MNKWGQSLFPPAKSVERKGMRFHVFHLVKKRKKKKKTNKGKVKQTNKQTNKIFIFCIFIFILISVSAFSLFDFAEQKQHGGGIKLLQAQSQYR